MSLVWVCINYNDVCLYTCASVRHWCDNQQKGIGMEPQQKVHIKNRHRERKNFFPTYTAVKMKTMGLQTHSLRLRTSLEGLKIEDCEARKEMLL
ncbi:hypothetical protein BaRGS_00032094 [Batillaria attramentaria]|uniref:Uncharacterized protein n=1 Tax=Batillaria attramentaria TaxID=370345 RepID=A0ABD0JPD0_9CAEN